MWCLNLYKDSKLMKNTSNSELIGQVLDKNSIMNIANLESVRSKNQDKTTIKHQNMSIIKYLISSNLKQFVIDGTEYQVDECYAIVGS